MKEQFLHIRLMRKGKVQPTGGMTFFLEYDEATHSYGMNYAKCSKMDVFSKKIGRLIAKGRYKKFGLKPCMSDFDVTTLLDHYYHRYGYKQEDIPPPPKLLFEATRQAAFNALKKQINR